MRLPRQLDASFGLEVEHHALLVDVDPQELVAVLARVRGHPGAAEIVALGRLYLDDFGSQVSQQHGAEGTVQGVGEVHHADIVQGAGHGLLLSVVSRLDHGANAAIGMTAMPSLRT